MQGAIETRFKDLPRKLEKYAHHDYEGKKWIDSKHLLVHLFAYSSEDRTSFEMSVVFDLDRGWENIEEVKQ